VQDFESQFFNAVRRIIKKDMKKDIHPEYSDATLTCVCGNVINTRSTKKEIKVEICSSCHPFITGKQKILDTAGRIESFRKKYSGLEKKKEKK